MTKRARLLFLAWTGALAAISSAAAAPASASERCARAAAGVATLAQPCLSGPTAAQPSAGLCPLGAPGPLHSRVGLLEAAEAQPDGVELVAVTRLLEAARSGTGERARLHSSSLPPGMEGPPGAGGTVSLQHLLPGGSTWDASLGRSYVVLGVEAMALYSLLRASAGDAQAPNGSPASAEGRGLTAVGVTPAGEPVLAVVEDGPAVSDGWMLALAPGARAAMSWRGTAPMAEVGVAGEGGASDKAGLAFITSMADRVAGFVEAFRGLRLNSFRLGDGTRVKIDAKTGRHGRFVVTFTRKF